LNQFLSMTRTHLINRERVRCQRFATAARREEGAYLHRSVTDEQRRSSGKDRQPFGLALAGRWQRCSSVTERWWLCSFVAPCQQPARAKRTHSLFMRWVLSLSVCFHEVDRPNLAHHAPAGNGRANGQNCFQCTRHGSLLSA